MSENRGFDFCPRCGALMQTASVEAAATVDALAADRHPIPAMEWDMEPETRPEKRRPGAG